MLLHLLKELVFYQIYYSIFFVFCCFHHFFSELIRNRRSSYDTVICRTLLPMRIEKGREEIIFWFLFDIFLWMELKTHQKDAGNCNWIRKGIGLKMKPNIKSTKKWWNMIFCFFVLFECSVIDNSVWCVNASSEFIVIVDFLVFVSPKPSFFNRKKTDFPIEFFEFLRWYV